jgi:very-short-patch-repair endonuclease
VAPVRKEVKRKKFSEAHLLLEAHLTELGKPFLREYAFCDGRRWRFDYLLEFKPSDENVIAIEIEGAIFTQGRHTRGAGYLKDLDKYRTAAALGYKVFRFSTQEVLNGTAKAFLEKWA